MLVFQVKFFQFLGKKIALFITHSVPRDLIDKN